jgi:hypothetical protein
MNQDAAIYDAATLPAQEDAEGLLEPPAPHRPVGIGRLTRTRLGLGSAALVALLVAGVVAVLLTRGGPDGPGSTVAGPAASPSAAATATAGSPSASAARPAPGGTARNPFIAPTPGGAGAGGAGGTGSAPAVTVTRTVTAAPSASPAPLYLGLYGWTGAKASFRVNQTPYLEASGQTFGGLFTFVAPTTLGSQQCAKVLVGTVTSTVCPGEVKQVR